MREFVKHIAESLRHDDTWTTGTHRLENEKLGVSIWTANGFWFIHVTWYRDRDPKDMYPGAKRYAAEGVDVYLTLIEKFVLWRAAKSKGAAKRRADAKLLEDIVHRRIGGK